LHRQKSEEKGQPRRVAPTPVSGDGFETMRILSDILVKIMWLAVISGFEIMIDSK
jgi:hypothetical protein